MIAAAPITAQSALKGAGRKELRQQLADETLDVTGAARAAARGAAPVHYGVNEVLDCFIGMECTRPAGGVGTTITWNRSTSQEPPGTGCAGYLLH